MLVLWLCRCDLAAATLSLQLTHPQEGFALHQALLLLHSTDLTEFFLVQQQLLCSKSWLVSALAGLEGIVGLVPSPAPAMVL